MKATPTNRPSSTSKPDYKKVVYRLNDESKYYDRHECPPGFEKLPTELKIEETRRPELIKSKIICRGRVKDGRYTFFTGLIPVSGSWYFGDHYHPAENKKNSFVLFCFTEGNAVLTIYYFNHFKLYPKRRGKFIGEFIRRVGD